MGTREKDLPTEKWIVPLVTLGWYLSFAAHYTFGARQDAPSWVSLIGSGLWQDDLADGFGEGLCSEWRGRFSSLDYS